ncbi:antitoxin [Nocardia otitidiscaviarum]|uniref:Antitoxin n=1 Tax=Nocardia otitidiscaviarum TaxID=1823 RepID=A0A378YBM3_9NOCA|nr:antitoxin [Nocardia otitidiscaviarum]MBF6137566.1 antitoxin [Nocardia otitidiscaviarum]MBF6182925.1 antitoxin [Nocardia otitidiscaviarum]MBF6239861.1 antitoxin [Nocardia otitidiscaviarum]MBF6488474.1 antitoxin [Nocardia otitidiscaviarum]MCP9622487.1 antitoxin [Nocardia otitidiscaviarum]
MGLFDNLKDAAGKAADLAAQHADKLEPVVDKAGDVIDQKTGGKYASQVDTAQEAAKKALREQAGKQ